MRNPNRNKSNTEFWESAKRNFTDYRRYYDNFLELALCMFEWENLPSTVDARFLELALLTDGMAVFFKDDVIGYLALRTMVGGNWNVYNIPTERTAYASNGYNQPLNETNSVLIYNNMLRTPIIYKLQELAQELYEIDRTIMVNVKAQKTPVLLRCTENQRLTLKNLYMQYEGNMPFIFADKGLDPDSIKALQTGAPYVADKLMQLRTSKYNEALTFLGISNSSYQKKERLVSDESIRSQGGTIANRYARLNARRQAADEINRMFGLNISVKFREDYREADDELMLEGQTGDSTVDTLAVDFRTN